MKVKNKDWLIDWLYNIYFSWNYVKLHFVALQQRCEPPRVLASQHLSWPFLGLSCGKPENVCLRGYTFPGAMVTRQILVVSVDRQFINSWIHALKHAVHRSKRKQCRNQTLHPFKWNTNSLMIVCRASHWAYFMLVCPQTRYFVWSSSRSQTK